MPDPGVADQLKILLSSEPWRLTVKGAASCATVAIGSAIALMVGGSFTTVGVTLMLTVLVTAGFTLSESEAVNVAVPLKLGESATLKVTLEVLFAPLTLTEVKPEPAVADQLKMLLSSAPERLTVK